MTISAALRKLYTAMCGGTTNKKTASEIVNAIADTFVGGGGDLPAVTADDNGDVLTVVSGAWAKAALPTEVPAASAAANGKVLGVTDGAYAFADVMPLIVAGTVDLEHNTCAITSDLTLAQIYAAANAGRSVYFECALATGNVTRIPLSGRTFSNDEYTLAFSAAAKSSSAAAVVYVEFENSTTGTFAILT